MTQPAHPGENNKAFNHLGETVSELKLTAFPREERSTKQLTTVHTSAAPKTTSENLLTQIS
jgi:hypothetical protein